MPYDPNFLFFSSLVVLFVAVGVFLAGWLPVYLVVMKLIGAVTSFFKRGPSRNLFQIQ